MIEKCTFQSHTCTNTLSVIYCIMECVSCFFGSVRISAEEDLPYLFE